MNAEDLLANRRRREGEHELANKKIEQEEKLRINNPRKKLDDEPPKSNQSTLSREIFVKLPQNIGQMMPQSNDRQRMREAMLGFPPMPIPNSNESQEPMDKRVEDHDEDRVTTPSQSKRKNSHPQQNKQNGRDSKTNEAADFSDQAVTTTPLGTEKTTLVSTTKGVLEEAVWDGTKKHSEKSDEGFSKKEPTNTRSVW